MSMEQPTDITAPQDPPKKKKQRTLPDWRPFYLVENHAGTWVTARTLIKRTARACAQTVAYRVENDDIHILDRYANRVTVFRSVHHKIPEEERTPVQRARNIRKIVKIYVKGHYKLGATTQEQFSQRDARGRRPPDGNNQVRDDGSE